MTLLSVQEAIARVRELQTAVLERQRFKGFSGRTRMISGTIALGAAAAMSSSWFPRDELVLVAAWGVVFVVAFVLNAVALMWWFWRDPVAHHDLRTLRPLIDVVPPLLVGGLLTAAMILHQTYHFLFGIWMCLFGLTNMASRLVLPKWIWGVGLFYIVAGAICLLAPDLDFGNPWPMGVVFFAGEWAGGIILHCDDTRNVRAPGHDEGILLDA
jgi:hypothetical protein